MWVSLADDEAFEAFVRAHGTALVRLAGALTGDPDVSEEVVQSALERVYVRWRRLNDPLAYTRQVVVNLCRERGRRCLRSCSGWR
jgi:DNA-directed RNA polymerase specialized sigma24 family protein